MSKLKTPLTESQIAVVDLLKEALAQALEGNITTVGIIACMENGFATVMAGSRAGDLNLGCDALKRKILDAVENSDKTEAVRSRILRVK